METQQKTPVENSHYLIDIEKATKQELIEEYQKCQSDWGMFSSDCYGFYVDALHRKIVSIGGWDIKTNKNDKRNI